MDSGIIRVVLLPLDWILIFRFGLGLRVDCLGLGSIGWVSG